MEAMADKELVKKGKQEVTREETTRPGRTYVPDVDIYETRDALWLWADMPGVDDKTLAIHLTGNVLTVEGQVATKEYEELSPVYAEYNVGNYVRRFTLSDEIDAGRIQARMKNGVLEVELPKSEAAKPRRIEVATG
jgi:HSP20 family molecular chaperone IbpA